MKLQDIRLRWYVCVVCVLPWAELTEGLEGGGSHVAESSVITQQQEGQHLKSRQYKNIRKKQSLMLNMK